MTHHKPIYILPGINFSSIIDHYEWFDARGINQVDDLTLYPSFSTGLVFIFYGARKIIASNENLKALELSSTILNPPTSILTYNRRIQNLLVFRIVFKPGALYYLFGIPLSEFHNKLVDSSTEIDASLKFLHEEMHEDLKVMRCIRLFENYLTRKMDYMGYPLIFSRAYEVIYKCGYNLKVEKLASEFAKSKSQMNRLMNRELGISMKKFLIITRFCDALRILNEVKEVNLIQLSLHLGYSYPSHFSDEFKSMCGYTPSDFLKIMGKPETEESIDLGLRGFFFRR